MAIPERRRREIEAKEAAREERYHRRLGDLVGLSDSNYQQPYAPALYGDAGIVCLDCRRFCGVAPIRLTEPGSKRCECCGQRLDHVLDHEPR
jgi:hypothetical protein